VSYCICFDVEDAVHADNEAVPEDGPYVETEKVAKLVLYLCSDAGEIVNGAVWTADAGITAN
jgi:enoyl-[acyl-carrier-protein] reductase (NADH)